jgi:putative transposase
VVSRHARLGQLKVAAAMGMSERRACALFDLGRSCVKRRRTLDDKDATLMNRMAELSAKHPRYGYRRIRALLGREGTRLSPERALRLWRKAGLLVPRKRPRRRVPRSQARPLAAAAANSVWAWDFVHDACANGQVLKCLTVVDEYTRECLAIEVASSIRSERVIEVVARLVAARGAPAHLRSDNGPEFVAQALQDWLVEADIKTAYSDPGKPWQNGLNESFNGKFRDECLDAEWFPSRREAVVVIEAYRRQYNSERPHSSLGYKTPSEFAQTLMGTVAT